MRWNLLRVGAKILPTIAPLRLVQCRSTGIFEIHIMPKLRAERNMSICLRLSFFLHLFKGLFRGELCQFVVRSYGAALEMRTNFPFTDGNLKSNSQQDQE